MSETKKYLVTYTAVVEAENEEEACRHMLDSDDTETSAEEIK